jgi:hypothetical protein
MSVSTSGRLPWLADVARAAGLAVVETDGWRQRGHADFTEVRGVMMHHTGDGGAGNIPALPALINGRPDLSGPLCNYALARDGTVYVVSAGVAWHAGTGVWSWLPRDLGNWYSVGIEAESLGTIDDWTPAQRTAYPQLCAAICRALGVDGSRVVGHKEYNPPPGKFDPAYWDMNAVRAQVKALLKGDDMDTATPVGFPADAAGYFDSLYPGLGAVINANFPAGKSAPFGVTTAYTDMCAAAALYVGIQNARSLATISTNLNRIAVALQNVPGFTAAFADETAPPPTAGAGVAAGPPTTSA